MCMSAAAIAPIRPESAVAPLIESVRRYARASRAESTLRGYRADWSDFVNWCEYNGSTCLPAAPATVAAYISNCADRGNLKAGTIQRRLSAIAAFHTSHGHGS